MNSRRYLMFFSYLGSGFRGSQFQKDFETVQNSIEVGLQSILELPGEKPIRVRLGSRTDTGVHALKAALIADLPPCNNGFMNPALVMRKLNKYFLNSNPKPIRIRSAYCVDSLFDFNSVLLDKTYLYRVGLLKKEFCSEINESVDPISEIQRTHIIKYKNDFNIRKAQEAAVLFEGSKDFGAVLGRPTHYTKPTVCNIMSFKLEEAQPLVPWDDMNQKFDYYHFICKGNRFLFHMVRRMVSLTLSVGYGRISLNSIKNLFEHPVPSSWPNYTMPVVSGSGLYLVDTNVDMEKVNLSIINKD